ncbi:integrase core domain-containing protein [Microgenomates group bacterium]|nr:integrase core domain-containing protein [Microgenomates group bacterium]
MGVNTYQICSSNLVGRWGYDMLMKSYQNSLKYETKKEIVDFRLHVLNHYYQFGLKSVLNAFPMIGKSTLYDWKKTYEMSKRRKVSLVPKSTKPKRYRQSQVDYRLIQFIHDIRNKCLIDNEYAHFTNLTTAEMRIVPYDLSKYKIKPFLDQVAQGLGIKSIDESTIGRIITQKDWYFKKKKLFPKKTLKKIQKDILRARQAPHPEKLGFAETDCIIHYVGANTPIKCINFIDVFGKIAYSQKVSSINSQNAKDAFLIFKQHCLDYYGFDIFAIQSDNGSEFFGDFITYFDQVEPHITQYHTLPRCPKINGVIERFNGILQTEFLNQSEAALTGDWLSFNQELTTYLSYYNDKRPHETLNLMSPKNYIEKYCSEM